MFGSVFAVVNLEDQSALVGPTVSWSVGENTTVASGAYVGLGERPDRQGMFAMPEIPSELGMIPTTLFLSMASYF